jgi:hypothetical protein
MGSIWQPPTGSIGSPFSRGLHPTMRNSGLRFSTVADFFSVAHGKPATSFVRPGRPGPRSTNQRGPRLPEPYPFTPRIGRKPVTASPPRAIVARMTELLWALPADRNRRPARAENLPTVAARAAAAAMPPCGSPAMDHRDAHSMLTLNRRCDRGQAISGFFWRFFTRGQFLCTSCVAFSQQSKTRVFAAGICGDSGGCE